MDKEAEELLVFNIEQREIAIKAFDRFAESKQYPEVYLYRSELVPEEGYRIRFERKELSDGITLIKSTINGRDFTW